MDQNVFSAMELDAIGEVMNISLGSSATAVSNLLDHRVDITTPSVSVVPVEEFSLGDLEPAIAVEIKYVSGLEGSNIMLLKRHDVKVIVDILMGTEMPDEEFELNDLSISAVCEVMNQMMGAASTALSDFLGRPVNISTPKSYTLDDVVQFKNDHFAHSDGMLVVVRFTLGIENVLKSEFVNVMSVDLARELLGGFGMDIGALDSSAPAPEPEPAPAPAAAPSGGDSGGKLSQEEIERLMGGMGGGAAAPEPAPAPAPAPSGGDSGGKLSQEEIERLMGGMGGGAAAPAPTPAPQPAPAPQAPPMQQPQQPQYAPPMQQPMQQPQYAPPMQGAYNPMMQQPQYPGMPPQYVQPMQPVQPQMQMEPKVINTKPLQLPTLDVAQEIGEEQAQNLELIMSVPLEVSVEIGRTRRKVEDILTFSKGSLVVLDKLAGDQVDLFVNGLCVARGDVVVIDDNFGVRITEVLRQPQLLDLAKKG
ncbi:MAG TPA: flagellar motor switch protein FliN [Candidatus Flavonifractor merdigallinarum]|uniref:Flagellar motor switch protein FliN n=1 Tax=Candidatus Flavonifractor merdigallinarum TaxID=2838589 RepID=A0A9D1YAA8_9FIRM|nr:flagellar motor switch protein FliN [Candidatus Flavonifractor merdigallinarum]